MEREMPHRGRSGARDGPSPNLGLALPPFSSLLSGLLRIPIQWEIRGLWDTVHAGGSPGGPRARWTRRAHGGWWVHSSTCVSSEADIPVEISSLPPSSLTLSSTLMKSGTRPKYACWELQPEEVGFSGGFENLKGL